MKVIITAVQEHKLGFAALLMRSAQQFHPEAACVTYVLGDATSCAFSGGEQREAAILFEEGTWLHLAFAHTGEALETIVLLRAMQKHITQGDTVIFAHCTTLFESTLSAFTKKYPPDTAVFALNQNENSPSNKGEAVCNAAMGLLTPGPKMSEYLDFCCEKFKHFDKYGMHEGRVYSIGDARAGEISFCDFWSGHAGRFCNVTVVPFENQDTVNAGTSTREITDFRALIARFDELRLPLVAANPVHNQAQRRRLRDFAPDFINWGVQYQKDAAASVPQGVREDPFAHFTSGVMLLEPLRALYVEDYRLVQRCGGNPFANEALFLEQNAQTGDENLLLVNAAMETIYRARRDLQRDYPHHLAADRLGFLCWCIKNMEREYHLPKAYGAPMRASFAAYQARLAAIPRSAAQKFEEQRARQPRYQPPMRLFQEEEKTYPNGVNLCGYIRGDFGVAEACRILATSLTAAGVPFTIVDFFSIEAINHTFNNHTWDEKITNQFIYNTNILMTNAPGTKFFMESVSPDAIKNRYNIGYWYWELPEFPTSWLPYFRGLDEIWVASDFTADSVRSATHKPVSVVPCCIHLDKMAPLERRDFGIDESAFVFLMMFDMMSSLDRKNPMGVLRAFLAEFEGDDRAQLVIKVTVPTGCEINESDPFLVLAKAQKNVLLLAGTYSRDKVNALLACGDVFVSLHRSEGFGLGPAEAMSLGKPAILTNWSGNTQYMTKENSCGVSCDIIEIQQTFGEYSRGRHWASPHEDEAGRYMKKLFEEPEYYARIAQKAKETIETAFSPLATGEVAREYLEAIWSKKRRKRMTGNSVSQEIITRKFERELEKRFVPAVEQIFEPEIVDKEAEAAHARAIAAESTLAPQFFASLSEMDKTRVNTVARPVVGNPISVFLRKIFRKMVRWYINPFAEQQIDFNTSATICTMETGEEIRKIKVQALGLRHQDFLNETAIASLTARLQELEARVIAAESALAKKENEK